MSRPGNLREVANLIEQQDRQFYDDINALLDAMGVPRREPAPGCKVVRLHPRPNFRKCYITEIEKLHQTNNNN